MHGVAATGTSYCFVLVRYNSSTSGLGTLDVFSSICRLLRERPNRCSVIGFRLAGTLAVPPRTAGHHSHGITRAAAAVHTCVIIMNNSGLLLILLLLLYSEAWATAVRVCASVILLPLYRIDVRGTYPPTAGEQTNQRAREQRVQTYLREKFLLGGVFTGGVVEREVLPLRLAVEHDGALVLPDGDAAIGQALCSVRLSGDWRAHAANDLYPVVL